MDRTAGVFWILVSLLLGVFVWALLAPVSMFWALLLGVAVFCTVLTIGCACVLSGSIDEMEGKK